ncbi:hypothetical protein [Deinococcus marmoris]|uniref:hypothetical protein n=1 Tax=Deinococcus marmoris TaxID=249408 RepID=UPI0004965EC9|nr:hypothetical protein [Deinococcus marmoris]
MHPAHLSCAFNGYDAFPLACLAADHAIPPEVQPFVLIGALADLEGMPPAYLFAVRDADVWRVIPVQEAKDAWRTRRRVAFWPLHSRLE